MHTAKYIPITAIVLFATLAGCASGPTIRSDYDRSADFASYRTYDFASELGTDRAEYSTLITSHFKRSVSRELEARGYRRSETNPDLLVNFFVAMDERMRVRSAPAATFGVGYYGYRYGLYTAWPAYERDVRTVTYKMGTANVDIVDAGRRQLIWEGIAEGRVTEEALANPGAAIEEVVAELFERFPATAGSTAVSTDIDDAD
ncbi:MAG TPA: DUF4136 domain-containing protein [Woeseiaceae bacterium]|nr:DUF4136 domain-containing protein [Woeseiaceae bacterium]